MQAEKPYVVIASGIAGVGKTTATEPFCRKHKVVFLDKDSVNRPFLTINPTRQNQLLPMGEYTPKIIAEGQYTTFRDLNGQPMLQFRFPTGREGEEQLGEYYGRYGMRQSYLLIANLTKDFLSRGFPVLFECPIRPVRDGTLAGMISGPNPFPEMKITDKPAELENLYPSFRGTPVNIIHIYTEPDILRQRLTAKAKGDKFAEERVRKMTESEEAFRKHLLNQPLLWPELSFFNHLVINNSNRENLPLEKFLQGITEQIENYVSGRLQKRDELLYRVDEQGKVSGAVHYSIAHPKNEEEQGIRHATADAFIFRKPDRKEIALQLRKGKVNKPGVWCNSSGGHVIHGDTPLQTIKQEAEEELFSGIGLPESLEFKLARTIPKQTRLNDPTLSIFYEAVYSGPFNPGEEVEIVEFVDIDRVKRDIKDNPNKYSRSLAIELTHI